MKLVAFLPTEAASTAKPPISVASGPLARRADIALASLHAHLQQLTLSAGDFAENILAEGIALRALPVGARLRVGETELEITQIGKECHSDCEIKKKVGVCVMPAEGVFAIVKKEGVVRAGDGIEVLA